MSSVAIHVDQLWFQTPGGIGTYIRNLVPAMARQDPGLDIRLFHARFDREDPPERWIRDFWVEELPAPIRTLYPRWDLLGRIRVHGAFRGSALATWRLLRCGPFTRGGFDPVPPSRPEHPVYEVVILDVHASRTRRVGP